MKINSSFKILILIVLSSFFTFCESRVSELSEESFDQWIADPENGLHRIVDVGEIRYDLQYYPGKEIISDKKPDSNKPTFLEFSLRMSVISTNKAVIKHRLPSVQEFENRIQYFNKDFKNDITLYNGDEKMNCIGVLYERSYDLLPYDSFVLTFEAKGTDQELEKVLVIRDRIFNNEIVKIKINQSALESIPKISR